MKNKQKITILTVALILGITGCQSSNDESVIEKNTQENAQENEQQNNPWTISDAQGVFEATGFDLKAPKDAEEIQYSFMNETKMAQMTYELDGVSWVYRIKATDELEDISGMNYEWTYVNNGTVSGRDAVFMGYSDATEDTEYIDSVKYVQVINWFDKVTGVSYSLSASGTGLNGMDIQVYAENIFEPLQGEATDDAKKDKETELKDYFLGEHVRDYDESSLVITEAEAGKYDIDISIIRLCSLENGIGTFADHVMTFVAKDPNENDIKGKIYRDADNTLTIEITDSTWDYLANGEKLTGF